MHIDIGYGAMFTNDLYPQVGIHVDYLKTVVRQGASIGSNSTINAGVTIGLNAVVGAGAVITKDVEDYSIYAGNPARKLKQFSNQEEMERYFRGKQKTLGN